MKTARLDYDGQREQRLVDSVELWRFAFLFAPVMVSLNSVRLPPGVPTPRTAFWVNAVSEVGAPGAPAVVPRP